MPAFAAEPETAASKTKRTVPMTKGSTWSILCCRLMHVPHTGCNVRFGSKADMYDAKRHVRFTPKSGHVQCNSECPLRANSGHPDVHFDYLVAV
jgi:hypothetical protein